MKLRGLYYKFLLRSDHILSCWRENFSNTSIDDKLYGYKIIFFMMNRIYIFHVEIQYFKIYFFLLFQLNFQVTFGSFEKMSWHHSSISRQMSCYENFEFLVVREDGRTKYTSNGQPGFLKLYNLIRNEPQGFESMLCRAGPATAAITRNQLKSVLIFCDIHLFGVTTKKLFRNPKSVADSGTVNSKGCNRKKSSQRKIIN